VCTLSWLISATGLELFFNRDERRTRGPELPPIVAESGAGPFVAPRDSDQGGSWIGVNARGLAVALLNGYRAADLDKELATSRGNLVLDAMASHDPAEVAARLRARDLSQYRSFVLAAFQPGAPPLVATWDRVALAVDSNAENRWPIVSSSVAGDDVTQKRRAVFLGLPRRDAATLAGAHASHENGPSAYSVCMHRDDGETRSFTRVSVDEATVRLAWSASAPCRAVAPVVVELARVR
jgi:Transport and Golgi organisation 2